MDAVSVLMDGELEGNEASTLIAKIEQNTELREQWETYHLIGDALRDNRLLANNLGAKIHDALAKEATVLSPHKSQLPRKKVFTLSAAASAAAVAVAGWLAFSNSNPLSQPTQVASVQTPIANIVSVNFPSDGSMSEYLLAHQEYSPSSDIQGVAPYARTVSTVQDK